MLKIEVTAQMLTTIAEALGGLPYRVAAPVLQEIDRQIAAQMAAPAAPPAVSDLEPVEPGLSPV